MTSKPCDEQLPGAVVQVGYGPRSIPHIIVGYVPSTPGKPYSAPVKTACGKRLSGLVSYDWYTPSEAHLRVECSPCLDFLLGGER